MMEFEKRGVPTVSFTGQIFVQDAQWSAERFGFSGIPMAVIDHTFTNQPPDVVRDMVEQTLDQVLAGLTKEVISGDFHGDIVTIPDEWLTIEGADEIDAIDRMNRLFLDYGWSDGFTLRPALERFVTRMLEGTTRDPEDVIAVLEPGFGKATVEKIATNAVMAGCLPEHLPVVIAAIECLADPRIMLRQMSMSTGPMAPLLWVNGPIAKRIGMNSGICALGPGAPSYVNSVIGRAVHLCMMNIGLTYPGVSDMDTIGSPAKWSMCVAENEDASPWNPYHVDHGYDREESTVTAHFVYGLCELRDFCNYEASRLSDVFASAMMNVAQPSTGLWLVGRRADPRHGVEEKEHHTLLICPTHAEIFRREGWGKAEIQKALFTKARMPFQTLMINKERKAMAASHPELAWLWESPETMLPVLEDPECYDIVVVGGAAGRGTLFYGAGEPVTKPITA
jgi:hypothetical protein